MGSVESRACRIDLRLGGVGVVEGRSDREAHSQPGRVRPAGLRQQEQFARAIPIAGGVVQAREVGWRSSLKRWRGVALSGCGCGWSRGSAAGDGERQHQSLDPHRNSPTRSRTVTLLAKSAKLAAEGRWEMEGSLCGTA